MKKNTCNHKDHTLWSRRSFLQGLGLSGISSMLFANSTISFATNNQLTSAIENADSENILLIIKLFGGNDGLNMIVPVNQYDAYANNRPTIKIPKNNLLNLTDEYAIPDFMSSLDPMWKEGKMKVVHSVGYDNQSKSHFKGSDLWASAEIDSNIQETGWLGRYYDNIYTDYVLNPPESPVAIQIGSTRNITFDGEEHKYSYAVANISSLQNIAQTGKVYQSDNIPDCEYGDNVSFLRNTYNSSYNYAGKIHDAYNRSSDYTGGVGGYPASTPAYGKLGESLNIIARLIKGNLGTKIYMVTLSGFDTHATQFDTHQGLLTNISETISYFHEDLTDAGYGDKILTMAQSEFGRRVAENGSKGTDHGAAGPILFFGESLQGSGFVGEHADLNDLVAGNLKHHTDFRQVYSSILKNWMCVDASVVNATVLGSEYEDLNLGFACETETETEVPPVPPIPPNEGEGVPDSVVTFETYVSFEGDDTIITLQSNTTQHITVTLYDIKGQRLGVIENSILYAGVKKINVKQKNPSLAAGLYIFKAQSNYDAVSKKILIQ
ncbi:hypothetical protein GCM10022393_37560 [Aquimarina addita]|uniref:DUF1501 domain-containing protein n=1 Tax=Aquimarina addita TaxID=870485 RepID=A0ABP6UV52_9FLAO